MSKKFFNDVRAESVARFYGALKYHGISDLLERLPSAVIELTQNLPSELPIDVAGDDDLEALKQQLQSGLIAMIHAKRPFHFFMVHARIEHMLSSPDTTQEDIDSLVEKANGFAGERPMDIPEYSISDFYKALLDLRYYGGLFEISDDPEIASIATSLAEVSFLTKLNKALGVLGLPSQPAFEFNNDDVARYDGAIDSLTLALVAPLSGAEDPTEFKH